MVQFCIEQGVAPYRLNDGMHKTLLHANYNIRIVNILLSCGVNSNIQDKHGETLLHCSNSLDIIRLLLCYNANPNIKNKNGNTPIHLHTQYGNTQIVKLFLKHGGNPNIKNSSGKTPLHYSEELETTKLLLSQPINIDETDNFGRTLLFEYTCSNNSDGIRMLLDYNANPNIKNNKENLPLHCANTLNIVKLLLPRTLNFDEKNKDGMTPLLKHVINNNVEIVQTLLKNGANPNIKNNEGYTALNKATTKKMKNLLLKFKAK
jgi:serine/threonine-protein phosphatase 6 regulatory ankyrin repeat subunit A